MPYINPADCRNLPFFPMEPTQLGAFGVLNTTEEIGFRRCAVTQLGRWMFHPSYELTRVIINTSNKTVFSRVGVPLPDTESDLFKPQLAELCSKFPKSWLDGYIRVLRTADDPSYGQGSFLIQDIILPEAPWWDRTRILARQLEELGICRPLPHRSIYRVPIFPEHAAINLWAATLEVQEHWTKAKKGTVYSGVVGKNVASEYGILPPGERSMAWMHYPYTGYVSAKIKPDAVTA